jgi:pimeloyl-ACP methyl ester carboxylesterase
MEPQSATPAWAQTLLETPAVLDPLLAATLANPLFVRPLYATMMSNKQAADEEAGTIIKRPMWLKNSTHDLGRWANAIAAKEPHALSRKRASYKNLRPQLALIWGAEDTVTPLAQANDLASLVPKTRLRVIANAGHVPQRERPKQFHDALLRLLEDPGS